jgi:hypothetical protein
MTTQYAVLPARSGRTYIGKLFTVAAPDTEVTGNAITVTERTNAKGLFRASIDRTTALPAGDYILVLLQGTLGAAVGYFTFAGTDGETATETPATVELDSDAQAMVTAFNAMRSGNVFTAPALANAPSGGSGLTGPFTRTITVTDAADDSPIEAAKVRLYRTGETETKPTEADGEISFTTEAATFSYAVTAVGYGGASGTIVISANGATTIELTATSVTPPTNPDLSAVVVSCLGTDFEPQAGVTIDLRIKTLPSGSTNTAYPGLKQTATSNGSGIATLEAPKGSVCEWKRGKEDSWTEITIGSGDQTNVTSIIGSRY